MKRKTQEQSQEINDYNMSLIGLILMPGIANARNLEDEFQARRSSRMCERVAGGMCCNEGEALSFME